MRKGDGCRKRCTECRGWFERAASAAKTQRVCGAQCRASRRRKLARVRRSKHVQDARVDEQWRQRESRRRRGKGECHAPPSEPKSAKLKVEVLDLWDEAAAMSRATLKRRWPGIYRAMLRSDGTAEAGADVLSRATLGSQVAGIAGESG